MKGTIVCYVGDYAICKDKNGEVFNIHKGKVNDFKEGDTICIDEKGNISKEKYYTCDDVVIFYDDKLD